MIICIRLGTVIKVLESWLGVEEWMDVAKRDPAQAAQLLEDRIHIEAARKNIQFLASRFTIKYIQTHCVFYLYRFLFIIIVTHDPNHPHHQPKKLLKKQQKQIRKHHFPIHDKCYKLIHINNQCKDLNLRIFRLFC